MSPQRSWSCPRPPVLDFAPETATTIASYRLVNGVLIVLGERSLDSCVAFDVQGDHAVTIDELLQGVNRTLNGPCRFNVGMTTLDFEDLARERPLLTNVWYPADEAAQEADIAIEGIFRGRAALAAPLAVAPQRFPVVLLSHGSGGNGSAQVWLAEHLAAHGYIVAAVFHFGNTTFNNRKSRRMKRRRRRISL